MAMRMRPGRDPAARGTMRVWPTSSGLLAGYCAMAPATAVAVAAGATHHPWVGLTLIAATALAVATRAALPGALGIGAMGWLFYAGFITGRHADLAWHGTASVWQLALLEAAAGCGAVLGWLLARPAPAGQSRSSRPAREPAAPVAISLATARESGGS